MLAASYVLSITLFLTRIVSLIVVHFVPGGVDPVRGTVSDYGASPVRRTRVLAGVASFAGAAAWIALGAAVLLDAALGAARLGVAAWLLVLGVVIAVIPFVPTDLTGAAPTARGRLHLLLAVGWFTIAYSTIGPLGRLLDPSLAGSVLAVANTVAGVALIALVASLVVPALRTRTFGLSERVFVAVVTVAPIVFALGALTR